MSPARGCACSKVTSLRLCAKREGSTSCCGTWSCNFEFWMEINYYIRDLYIFLSMSLMVGITCCCMVLLCLVCLCHIVSSYEFVFSLREKIDVWCESV